MRKFAGNIQKMTAVIDAEGDMSYRLPIGGQEINVNALIGGNVSIAFSGIINCIHCGAQTEKSHKGGYCEGCAGSLAEADVCRTSPERCHYEAGTCRDSKWGDANCMGKHIVYLSNTGKVKVGITRHVNDTVSSRWIDQGATSALPVIVTQNRLLSGLVETLFKQHVSDRTNWRAMLKAVPEDHALPDEATRLRGLLEDDIAALQNQYGIMAVQWLEDTFPVHIHYPVSCYPDKVSSINLDKTPSFEGVLCGVKGQYWLFECGSVINLRKYAGYRLSIE